ncbi:MAG TPA: DNA repair protein RecN [Candidatus Polarisedimenticolaceae bacterium]|nr:DNA repair protein RecN [Candidatus Polarisedimenticolaceae bacterium]
MLRTLRIRNLATIEDLEVELTPGLNVITGETGAGKSIVVTSLGLACGDRADASLLRAGADRAVVEAAFEPEAPAAVAARLDAAGLDAAEGEVVVRRELAASGSGRTLVNGSPTTVGALREIGDLLVDLHGQHESRGLLAPERQLEILDTFGGHADALARVEAACAALASAADLLARRQALAREGQARELALRETVRAIGEAAPREGELEALRRERAVLQNGSRVAGLLDETIAALDEAARVRAAERRMDELAAIDPPLDTLSGRLAAARVEIEDVRDTLTAYRDARDFDPARLDAIETRRVAIERLLLRFGPDEADALRLADEAAAELRTLANIDAEVEAAAEARDLVARRYDDAAGDLTRLREESASRLGRAVEHELAPLALPKARFTVVLAPRGGTAHPRGNERAEFQLAANPGEPPRPLARSASGGELSRVLLALHVASDVAEDRRVLVFDEVDAGVSGAVALAVGARLARLAAAHQVLCVTHLPQVAAHARSHYHVSKRARGGRTHTAIVVLDGEARVDELARMLGGKKTTEAARENAAELLEEARGGRR